MLTYIELLFLIVLATATVLLTPIAGYYLLRLRIKKIVRGYIPTITKSIAKQMSKEGQKLLEGVDLGAIAGQLGGDGGEGNPLGAISGLLGGGGGGIGDLLKLLSAFSGKQTTKGTGKMGL